MYIHKQPSCAVLYDLRHADWGESGCGNTEVGNDFLVPTTIILSDIVHLLAARFCAPRPSTNRDCTVVRARAGWCHLHSTRRVKYLTHSFLPPLSPSTAVQAAPPGILSQRTRTGTILQAKERGRGRAKQRQVPSCRFFLRFPSLFLFLFPLSFRGEC